MTQENKKVDLAAIYETVNKTYAKVSGISSTLSHHADRIKDIEVKVRTLELNHADDSAQFKNMCKTINHVDANLKMLTDDVEELMTKQRKQTFVLSIWAKILLGMLSVALTIAITLLGAYLAASWGP